MPAPFGGFIPIREREASIRKVFAAGCGHIERDKSGVFPGPEWALILLAYRRHAFIDELLHTLAAICLRNVEISLRIRGDAVGTVKFARLTAAFTKGGQDFKRITQQNVNSVVF